MPLGPLKKARPLRSAVASAKAGFSLIEALAVLMIAGMALTLVFGVGVRATSLGLRLGLRALDAADRTIGVESLRASVRGLVLEPDGASPSGPVEAIDEVVFQGRADGFSGAAVLDAAIPCAAAGPAWRLRVFIERRPDGDRVACQAGRGAAATLLTFPGRRARFAYSTDGRRWSDRWTATRSLLAARATVRERRLYVRLDTDDGSTQLIARGGSGRPALWGHAAAGATP